MYPLII